MASASPLTAFRIAFLTDSVLERLASGKSAGDPVAAPWANNPERALIFSDASLAIAGLEDLLSACNSAALRAPSPPAANATAADRVQSSRVGTSNEARKKVS